MGTATTPQIPPPRPVRTMRTSSPSARSRAHIVLLFALWLAIFFASLVTPPLLDDADATHAQAAQSMLRSGDLVTLHVDGVRYLEKPPLPYWIAAVSLRLFAANPSTFSRSAAFAVHLPLALTVLGLALLGYLWARRAFGTLAGFYTALFLLTSAGVFLFTRIFIPDALLSLLLGLALYAFLRALDPLTRHSPRYAYTLWLALALAVLTKGLVALIFFFGTAILFLLITRQTHLVHKLKPAPGLLLFLAVAAPWHILASLRNTGGANGHGFLWFYFVNEHVLRFLGRRIPQDYNKLPTALYWSLHLVWLFPWSLFTPAALLIGWRHRRARQALRDLHPDGRALSRLELLSTYKGRRSQPLFPANFAAHTVLLLGIFSALVLVVFSFSTNQEYYTFPIYLPLLMLLAAALASIPSGVPADTEPSPGDPTLRRLLSLTYAVHMALGLLVAAALASGLYTSRHLPFAEDIGAVLAHRNVAGYTLSMSHFFDLTGPSFAALRLPAVVAGLAFALGPAIAWVLHARRRGHAAILTVAFTSAAFLVAAHLALVRFTPMLSSQSFAATIQSLERNNRTGPETQILLFGDQSFGSSIPFYLDADISPQTGIPPVRRVLLVDGRSTSMLFGSTFPDAPPIFLTHEQLLAAWTHGPRKILFVPADLDPAQRTVLDGLQPQLILQQTSGKLLLTDRPLDETTSPESLTTNH